MPRSLADFRKKYPTAADYSDAELLTYLSESTGRPLERVASDFGVDIGQNSGDFMRGVKRGWEETKGVGVGAAALGAGMVGADETKDAALSRAKNYFDRAGMMRRESDDFTNIDSAGGALDWAQGAMGELVPMVIPSIVSGGVGAAVGKAAAKGAVKKAVTAEAAREIARTGAKRGAIAGAYGASVGQEAGSIYPDMVEEGEDDPARALGFGALAGALDVVPEARIFGKVLGGGERLAGGVVARAAKEGGKQALLEGGTEVGQSVIERIAARKALDSDEALNEYINAGAAGALGGGVLGAPVGALQRQPIVSQPTDLLTNRDTAWFGQKAAPLSEPAAPADVAGQVFRVRELMRQAESDGDMNRFYTLQEELQRLEAARPRESVARSVDLLGTRTATLPFDQPDLLTQEPTQPAENFVAPEHSSGGVTKNGFEPALVRALSILRAAQQTEPPPGSQFEQDAHWALDYAQERLGDKLAAVLHQYGGMPPPGAQPAAVSVPAAPTAPPKNTSAIDAALKAQGMNPTGARRRAMERLMELNERNLFDEGEYQAALDALKTNKRGTVEELIALAEASAFAKADPTERMQYLLSRLDARARTIVERVAAGEDMAEIGKTFDVSKSAVQQRHSRAINQLVKLGEAVGADPALIREMFKPSNKSMHAPSQVSLAEAAAGLGASQAKDDGNAIDALGEAGYEIVKTSGSTAVQGSSGPQMTAKQKAAEKFGRALVALDDARTDAEIAAAVEKIQKLAPAAGLSAEDVASLLETQQTKEQANEEVTPEAVQGQDAAVDGQGIPGRGEGGGQGPVEATEEEVADNAELTDREPGTYADMQEAAARSRYEEGAGGDDPKWDDFSARHKRDLIEYDQELEDGVIDDEVYNHCVMQIISAHEAAQSKGDGIKRSVDSQKPRGDKGGGDAKTIESNLRRMFFSRMLFSRRVRVVQSVEDLYGSVSDEVDDAIDDGNLDDTQGFVLKGHVYLIADNISPGRELSVLLHELAGHIGLRSLLGKDHYNALVDTALGWLDVDAPTREHDIAIKAMKRATDSGDLTHFREEFLAYFIEEAVNAGVDPTALKGTPGPLERWCRRMWAAMKVSLRKIGLGRMDDLTAQNVVDLAFGAARLEITGVWSGFAVKFRQQKDEHVGKGEGTSWESWGHYGSEIYGVASWYMKNDVSRKWGTPEPTDDGGILVGGKPASKAQLEALKGAGVLKDVGDKYQLSGHWRDVLAAARRTLSARLNNSLEAIEQTKSALNHKNADRAALEAAIDSYTKWAENAKSRLAALDDIIDAGVSEVLPPPPEGRIYRSDTAVDEDMLINWNGYLADLSKPAREALAEAAGKLRSIRALALDPTLSALQNLLVDNRYLVRSTGEALIHYLEETLSRVIQEGRIDEIAALMPSDREREHLRDTKYHPEQFAVVAILRGAGLQGVYYPTAENPTKNNYVIWSDRRIKPIVRKVREFDAVTQEESGRRTEILFSKQAKDTEDAVKSALAPATKTAQHYGRKLGLSLLFGHQLVERIASLLPSAKTFFDTMQQKVTLREQREQRVNDISTSFLSLHRAVQQAVNSFLYDATTSQKWAYKPDWDAEVEVDPEMKARFDKLAPEAQDVVKQVFAYGHETQREYEQVLLASMDAELLQQIDEAKGDAARTATLEKERNKLLRERGALKALLKGPYAPLKRFGKHVVVVASPEYRAAQDAGDRKRMEELQSDPEHYYVEFFESRYEAEKAAMALRETHGDKVMEPFEREPEGTHTTELPLQAMKRIQHAIEEGPNGSKLSATMKRTLSRLAADLYVASLDSMSARHSQQRRRNIAGADKDMMRAFVSQGRGMAQMLAAIETSDALQQSLQTMRSEARRNRTSEKADALNEVLARYAAIMDTRPTPVQDALMTVSSFWMLLTSPAYWITNATQPVMMSLPVIAGQHTMGRSVAALWSAYRDTVGALEGRALDVKRVKNQVAQESDMLQTLMDRGHIDLTLERELGEVADAHSRTGQTAHWIMSKVRLIPQRVEVMNRVSTAVAAYRLEYAKALSEGIDPSAAHDQAVQYADQTILDTHGDYSAAGAPRALMQGGKRLPVKLMGQFRKFQLIQLALVFKVAKQAFSEKMTPDQRAVARRSMAWLLGTYGVATGLTGLVGVQLLWGMLAAMFGDDDEKDLDLVLTRALGDRDTARLLLHGVPAAMGVDVSGRVGMGNVLSIFPYTDSEPSWRESYKNVVMSATGPFIGGLLPRAASGVDYMRKGDYWKGVELLMPNGVTNVMRAARFASDGLTNSKGDVLFSPDELAILTDLSQAIGLPSTTLTERQWKSDVLYDMNAKLQDETKILRQQYADAAKDRDLEEMADLRKQWMAMQEVRKRNGMKVQPLSTLLKSPMERRQREGWAREGVALTRNTAGFTDSIEQPNAD